MEIAVNDQIHLSEIRSGDKSALVEHLADKEIYDRTLRIPYPYTEADADTWLAIAAKATEQYGRPVHWAIREKSGKLIGGCGFDGLIIGHRAEIGYWLAKPYWSRGIMTTVVSKMCEVTFEAFGLVRIYAHVFASNSASARVLEKCRFQQEGYLRKHFLKDGQFLDARLYALVK